MEKEKKTIKTSGRFRWIMILFIRAILILAIIFAIFKDRRLILYLSFFALAVTFIPNLIYKLWRIKIPAEFEVIVFFFIYGVLFLGEVRGFFAEFWWWDILLNLLAAVALGFIGITIMYTLYKEERINASPLMIVFFAFCFAVAIGALWEVFEFTMDNYFNFTLQKSSFDTMKDVTVNIIGAFLVSVGGYYHIKSGKNPLSSLVIKLIAKNPKIFKGNKIIENSENQQEELKKLIKKGERNNLEFKSSLRTNIHTNQIDRKVEHSVLKTLNAYLNSEGGTLLVGVSDEGEILGLDTDKFISNDKLNLHLTNLIKNNIGHEYLPYISHEIISLENKNILKISCLPSKKHVFLKTGNEEEFYVRNGPSSAKISGSALVSYINNRFNSKGA